MLTRQETRERRPIQVEGQHGKAGCAMDQRPIPGAEHLDLQGCAAKDDADVEGRIINRQLAAGLVNLHAESEPPWRERHRATRRPAPAAAPGCAPRPSGSAVWSPLPQRAIWDWRMSIATLCQ